MQALDELIITEERKIDHLTSIRHRSGSCSANNGRDCRPTPTAELDYDLEKAYEQLAIYKIRKLMDF